jgi:cyclophilin family peptidyl-prolyl cis-trans isomerase
MQGKHGWILVALVMLPTACPAPRSPSLDRRYELRREIAMIEARRGTGDQLWPMIVGGDALRSALATRALGRIGGPAARGQLIEGVRCAERGSRRCLPDQVASAAAALGIQAALEEPEPAQLAPASEALLAALARSTDPSQQATVLEALGRAGSAAAQPAIVGFLDHEEVVAEAAAIALGRLGRRKIAWTEGTRAALLAATRHRATALRFAATWALSRESVEAALPSAIDAEVAAALAQRSSDADPETRAVALAALARRKLAGQASAAIAVALGDADWRVAVEAVRAQASVGDDAGFDRIVQAVVARLPTLARIPADIQVVVEGLRQLAGQGGRASLASQLRVVLAAVETVRVSAPVAAGWMRCLASAAIERAAINPDLAALARCGGSELPPAYAASVVVDAVGAGAGAIPAQRAAIDALWNSADPRVRAAAITALPALLAAGDATTRVADLQRLTSALQMGERDGQANLEAMIVAAAIETLGKVVPADVAAPAMEPAAVAAVQRVVEAAIARARHERDPELAGALLDFIAERKLSIGLSSCQAAAASASPVIARAAARCRAAIEGSAAAEAQRPAVAEPPPVDLARALGAGLRWRWTLTTAYGVVEVDLDGAVAPWHVAAIVALTDRRFYDGLEFHRVVGNFVVQGGDPTQSGSGGPGFALPAEPGSRLDGDSYRAGAVGFADAGKDSGGSQWFAMHSRAPHLEGRYTRVGQVVRGQAVIDRLLVGDRVIRARVTLMR